MSGSAAVTDFRTLVIFWLGCYLSAILAQKTRLSPLVFYLMFGCILGNVNEIDGFHIIPHSDFIGGISELGITLVFFALGFEENVTHFVCGVKKAWGIASIGALVPFCCGFGTSCFFFPDVDIKAHVMVALAVTATAVSLTMISLKSLGLALSNPAIGIMTSAVLDDVACLALVAILLPICSGEAEPTAAGISWIIGKSCIFFAVITVTNMFILPTIDTQDDADNHPFLSRIPGLRAVGASFLLHTQDGEHATVLTILFGVSMGLVATAFDFHPAIGAYMAGLILEERYYDFYLHKEAGDSAAEDEFADDEYKSALTTEPDKRNSYHHVNEIVESAAYSWIGPIFFFNLGSKIIIKASLLQDTVAPMFGFFIALFIGQVLSASLAARFVPGGFTWAESWMIGFGMLGRAELFFVVLDSAYLEYKILTDEMFFSLTLAAMLLNISVPVTISLYKPYYMRAVERDGSKLKAHGRKTITLQTHILNKVDKDARRLDQRTFVPDEQMINDRRESKTRTCSKPHGRSPSKEAFQRQTSTESPSGALRSASKEKYSTVNLPRSRSKDADEPPTPTLLPVKAGVVAQNAKSDAATLAPELSAAAVEKEEERLPGQVDDAAGQMPPTSLHVS